MRLKGFGLPFSEVIDNQPPYPASSGYLVIRAVALPDTLIIPTHCHCDLLGPWGIQKRLGSLETQNLQRILLIL